MALSQDNVALVQSVYQAVNDNELDTFLGLMHDDVELTTSGVYPDFLPIYRGREGALKYWEAARGIWDNFTVEIRRVEAVGDRVLVLLHQIVEGRDGIVVEHDWGHLFAFADGRIRQVIGFASWQSAIAEAGAESVAGGG